MNGSWLSEVNLGIDYTGKQQITVRVNGFSSFVANCLVDPLDPAIFAGKISVNGRSVWLRALGVLEDEVELCSHVITEQYGGSLYCTAPRLLDDSVVRLNLLLAGNEVAMLSKLFFPNFIKGLTVDALVSRRACF